MIDLETKKDPSLVDITMPKKHYYVWYKGILVPRDYYERVVCEEETTI